ncbi:DUF4430 domain-containing protein [Fusibacter sp. JL298sf-3]
MKNKLVIALVVVLVAVGALFAYNQFFGAETQEGSKAVTVEVVIPSENIDEKMTLHTDAEYLYDLLEEKKETLGTVFDEQDFGPMLIGMKGYVATQEKKEFYHISINGEPAMVGVKDIPVLDGDVYRFEIQNWE